MAELFLDPPFWLWMSLAGALLLLEVNLGTFDLLWPAAGAGLTGLATQAPFTPSGPAEWLLFIVITLALTIAARTAGFKRNLEPKDKRILNSGDTRIGKTVTALESFSGASGRVRMGDTDWSARVENSGSVSEGQKLTVTGTDGTVLIVEPSQA